MTDIVRIGDATLYHADCRDVLPTLPKFDLLLTDPPYGIGRDGKPPSTSSHGGHKGYEFAKWDRERPSAEVFAELLSSSVTQVIWGGNYFSDMLPPSMRWLVWDKGQRICQADGELAWTSMQAAMRIFTLNRVELMRDGALHPTQKPVALMAWCLDQVPTAKSVLDPFMGSGTTGVACAQSGRAFTGIERERKYFDIACERIERAYAQGKLFQPEPAKPEQQEIAA